MFKCKACPNLLPFFGSMGIFDLKESYCFWCANDKIVELEDRNDKLQTKLDEIENWCKAYPVDIFPEPDMDKVRSALTPWGITIDSVSASMMRHVLKGIQAIINRDKEV